MTITSLASKIAKFVKLPRNGIFTYHSTHSAVKHSCIGNVTTCIYASLDGEEAIDLFSSVVVKNKPYIYAIGRF